MWNIVKLCVRGSEDTKKTKKIIIQKPILIRITVALIACVTILTLKTQIWVENSLKDFQNMYTGSIWQKRLNISDETYSLSQ